MSNTNVLAPPFEASLEPGRKVGEAFGFPSRRSVVHSAGAMVACSQPLAARCGVRILEKGGNSADAAVAVAAALNMTEPCSTGIGGDMFALHYNASTRSVSALNGSGRSGAGVDRVAMRHALGIKDGEVGKKIPMSSPHAVTVPGAAAGWADTVARFGSGKVTLEEVLAPAAELGEKGFPVSEGTAYYWAQSESSIRRASPNFTEILKKDPAAKDGVRAPSAGEIMRNPTLAETFRTLGREGKNGFYTGRIAEQIVKVVSDLGGKLTLDDLAHHLETGSESVDPIGLDFTAQGCEGIKVWEHPPNGQGIVALMALGVIQELEKSGKIPRWGPEDFNTAPYLHAIIEALRLGFTDASWYVADPNVADVPTQGLISPAYLAERAKLFDPAKASEPPLARGDPTAVSPALNSSDTVYFCVADAEGNATSFINSNYGGFGTCIVPSGTGFTLQNRGANFSLDEGHPNSLEPRKRPYHTIIPGLTTNLSDGSLHSAFGVMGGFMQPQGHVQVLLGQVVGGLDPQQALDAPRVCVTVREPTDENRKDWVVQVEDGMKPEVIEGLKERGHLVEVVEGWGRHFFGRGQIIKRVVDPVEGIAVWSAGSDMRADGAAFPH